MNRRNEERLLSRWFTPLLVAAAFLLAACGGDNDEPQPELQTPKGEVTYNVDGPTATPEHPAIVTEGTPVELTLTQKNTYTDANGRSQTSEPKATIRLTTLQKVAKAASLAELTAVKETTEQKTTGSNPQTRQILQTFHIGGQDVVFDLAYEVFSYQDESSRQVELPYIRLGAARYGEAAVSTTHGAAASLAVTAIRLKPLPKTRGTLTETTDYEVTVGFNLTAETVGAQSTALQTFAFEVQYSATVETTTDYPDPETTFSYQLSDYQGTTSTASPFALSGAATLALQWTGQSRHTWFSLDEMEQKAISLQPKASVTVEATKDTIWVTNKEELEKLATSDVSISQDGAAPLVTSGHQVFSMSEQAITLNWRYDTYEDVDVEGTSVAMPHLELGEPQIVSVSATELTNASVPGKQAKVYAVEVRLSQELKSVNDAKESTESIEYVVKFIGAIDVKLVKVVYRKDWEWVDPHDNMMLAYYPMVYRDRIYSTGETFTDTFRDLGHVAGGYIPFSIGGEPIQEVSDGVLVRTKWLWEGQSQGDSIVICPFSASVPNLDKVFDVFEYEGDEPLSQYTTPPPGTWDEYETGKLYTDLDISLDGVEVVGADSISAKPSGWYFYRPDYVYNNFVCIYGDEFRLLQGEMHISFYDQFLVIDGRLINFLEFRGPMHFNYRKEYITMPNGAPGFVYTTEFRRKFLEKNFYFCRIDSIYQQNPTPAQGAARMSGGSFWQNARSSKSSMKSAAAPSRRQLPPPYNLPTFTYGGKPEGVKGRY